MRQLSSFPINTNTKLSKAQLAVSRPSRLQNGAAGLDVRITNASGHSGSIGGSTRASTLPPACAGRARSPRTQDRLSAPGSARSPERFAAKPNALTADLPLFSMACDIIPDRAIAIGVPEPAKCRWSDAPACARKLCGAIAGNELGELGECRAVGWDCAGLRYRGSGRGCRSP